MRLQWAQEPVWTIWKWKYLALPEARRVSSVAQSAIPIDTEYKNVYATETPVLILNSILYSCWTQVHLYREKEAIGN
jgi:hypothetical protein